MEQINQLIQHESDESKERINLCSLKTSYSPPVFIKELLLPVQDMVNLSDRNERLAQLFQNN